MSKEENFEEKQKILEEWLKKKITQKSKVYEPSDINTEEELDDTFDYDSFETREICLNQIDIKNITNKSNVAQTTCPVCHRQNYINSRTCKYCLNHLTT